MIRDVWVNVLTQSISQFLDGAEFELPTDISKIDHLIEEIKKVKTKKIGIDDKLMNLRWIRGLFAAA